MFKKGDKVRRINCDWKTSQECVLVGEIYTVIDCYKTTDNTMYFGIYLKEKICTYEGYNFELYEDDFPELLKKAKEIRRLGDKLVKDV